jgi:hypothetical protein
VSTALPTHTGAACDDEGGSDDKGCLEALQAVWDAEVSVCVFVTSWPSVLLELGTTLLTVPSFCAGCCALCRCTFSLHYIQGCKMTNQKHGKRMCWPRKLKQFDQLANADGSIPRCWLHLPHVLMRVAAYHADFAHWNWVSCPVLRLHQQFSMTTIVLLGFLGCAHCPMLLVLGAFWTTSWHDCVPSDASFRQIPVTRLWRLLCKQRSWKCSEHHRDCARLRLDTWDIDPTREIHAHITRCDGAPSNCHPLSSCQTLTKKENESWGLLQHSYISFRFIDS